MSSPAQAWFWQDWTPATQKRQLTMSALIVADYFGSVRGMAKGGKEMNPFAEANPELWFSLSVVGTAIITEFLTENAPELTFKWQVAVIACEGLAVAITWSY